MVQDVPIIRNGKSPKMIARLPNLEEEEPLYMTTIPDPYKGPEVPPRPSNLFPMAKSPPKGILKNSPKQISKKKKVNGKSCSSSSVLVSTKKKNLNSEEVGHLNFHVHEPKNFPSTDANHVYSKPLQIKNSEKTRKILTSDGDQKCSDAASSERGFRAARVESISGIIHLLVIVLCIVTIATMAKLTGEWETKRRRCPLYVKNTPNVDIYWGNEKMAPCHYVAFMPVLILIMSFTLIIFHGGILWSWRSGGNISKLLLSKSYPKMLFYLEFFEFLVALTVACVISDGFRQTCVGFQLNPWLEERPDTCKDGYYERDDAYDISKTYSRIMASIVTSWFTCILLLSSSILYFRRSRFCRNTTF